MTPQFIYIYFFADDDGHGWPPRVRTRGRVLHARLDARGSQQILLQQGMRLESLSVNHINYRNIIYTIIRCGLRGAPVVPVRSHMLN